MNLYDLHLRFLSKSFVFREGSDEALYALSKAVQSGIDAIQQAEETGFEDYYEAVVDTQCETVENLLGTAFVTSQVHITAVVSAITKLHKCAGRDKHALRATSGKKPGILSFGDSYVAGTGVTPVAAIDAFANYFKHRDEWGADWSKLDNRSCSTANVIEKLGACSGNSGNMRTGAEALGNPSYTQLTLFVKTIDLWRSSLEFAYRAELATLGLVAI